MTSRNKIASVTVRTAFAVVFAMNVQCAISFLIAPGEFVGGFMLGGTGRVGEVAVAGLGVAFLMWNATYPAYIAAPARFPVLGAVILAQQLIGLLGETCLFFGLGTEYGTLRASLLRFMVFDGAGLLVMAAAFTWFTALTKKKSTL